MKIKNFEIKEFDAEGDYHFIGYATTYGNADRSGDVMEHNSFLKDVGTKKIVPMLFNHDKNEVIGHLELSHDQNGVLAKGKFNKDLPKGAEVMSMINHGDINSLSIGFIVHKYEPIEKDRPFGSWLIKEAEILETSVVTVPANPMATVEATKKDFNDIEQIINETIERRENELKIIKAKKKEIKKILKKEK